MIKNTNLLRILLLTLPVIAGAWGLRDIGGRPTLLPTSTPLLPTLTTSTTLLTSTPLLTPTPDKRSIHCFIRSFHITTADDQGIPHTTPIFEDRVYVCGDLWMMESVTHSMEHRPPDTDRYEDYYAYLVFEKDSLTGIEYQSKWPDSTSKRAVDASTTIRRANDTMVLGILGRQRHLVTSVQDPHTGVLTEIYTRLWDQPRDVDTCRLYYSKRLEGLPFFESLSSYLDSTHNARLFEVRVTIDSGFSQQLKRMVGKGEMLWKLEENAFFNRDSIYGYFTRYVRDCRGIDGR
jgi:hypothetical protein